jgi:cytochrome c oxidase assembly factor CtaG
MNLNVLTHWSLEPYVIAPLVSVGVVHGWAVSRVKGGAHRGYVAMHRILFLAASLVVAGLALESPVGFYADQNFSVHMVQHLLLTLVVAPLFVLGAPVTLALQAATPSVRRSILLPLLHSRAVRALASPVVTWGLFALVLPLSHIPAFYDLTLRSEGWHAFEHLALLFSATLFWWPVIGVDPMPIRVSHPARVLYLFLIMPVMTFIGLAIYNASHVLYAPYVAASGSFGSALSDQHLAGAFMWEAGMFLIVPALGAVLIDWMNRDEKETAREDERRARRLAGGVGASPLNGEVGS